MNRLILRLVVSLVTIGTIITTAATASPEAAYAVDPSGRTTKAKLRAILDAKDDATLRAAVLTLEQQDFDFYDFTHQLEELLTTRSVSVRRSCAIVVTRLQPGQTRSRLLKAVARSLETAGETIDSKRLVNVAFLMRPVTEASYFRSTVVAQLSEMEGADIQELKEAAPTDTGWARDCFIIARAAIGDSGARTELTRIARTSEDWLLRQKAVAAFQIVGEKRDLLLLREIAETDPYCVSLTEDEMKAAAGIPASTESLKGMVYPVRAMAKEVTRYLEAQ